MNTQDSKKMEILVYGDFKDGMPGHDGATTKTRNIFAYLVSVYGPERVKKFSFGNWHSRPLKAFLSLKKATSGITHLIVVPGGENGLKFALFFFSRKSFLKKIKVLYPIAGGWLFDFLEVHKKFIKKINRFDAIFPETKGLKGQLESLGVSNAVVSPVFSARVVDRSFLEPVSPHKERFFCSFCRVTDLKGIDVACEAVNLYNQSHKDTEKKISYDIFGAIDQRFAPILNHYISLSEGFIKYKGPIEDTQVLATLSRYEFALFPTRFWGECFPASVLECFLAGVPVIASSWKYNSEFVLEGKTGYLYSPVASAESLAKTLDKVMDSQNDFRDMRKACFSFAESFSPNKAMLPIIEAIEKQR